MPSLDWYRTLELRIKTLEEYLSKIISCKQEKERLIEQSIGWPRLQDQYITDLERYIMFGNKIKRSIANMKNIQQLKNINAQIALNEFNNSSKIIKNINNLSKTDETFFCNSA